MNFLLILATLLTLRIAATSPNATRLLAAPALLLCAVAGLTLPDIDQPLPLDHRSALTHSLLPALACAWRWARPAAAGLALGLGLHLAADIFPNAMTGFATVKLPLAGSIGPTASYLWLAANAALCLALGLWLASTLFTSPTTRAVIALATALIGLSYLLSVDGGWPALAILLGGAWLALRKPAAA